MHTEQDLYIVFRSGPRTMEYEGNYIVTYIILTSNNFYSTCRYKTEVGKSEEKMSSAVNQ